jgi:hypothetical protein
MRGSCQRTPLSFLLWQAESHIQIQQLNGITVGQKVLISLFNAVCNITLDGKSKESDNMFERVMKSTSVTLNADVAAAIEERRLLWTNYDNLFAQVVCKSAFEEAFSIVNNQCSWAKVGAATPQGVTMACLNDPKVTSGGPCCSHI